VQPSNEQAAKLVVPRNIFLPSHPPELNPVENIWQYLRAN
jgi:transposase